LGRYLLRDLTLANVPVAVVVRGNRRQSAEDRIESLMSTWEDFLERELDRPQVLEGDICEPFLGLDSDARHWVDQNCDSVLHNAASLSFVATSEDGEPYRSNIKGTQHVLDLCRETGIRDFHQVSTAYVAGLRTGRIMESDLDVGQQLSNPYEESKIAAEKLVRSADFLSPPTIYRPAIIVGDSETGFTSTFHGFYACLELAHTLVNSMGKLGTNTVGDTKTRISLDGTETKNFIPVDWVSEVITYLVTHRQHHGQTYHLTPRQRVSAGMIRDVLEHAYGFKGAEFSGYGKPIENPTEIEQLFYEQIRVYSSYWRDDPEFDTTNLDVACPHIPCPTMDRDLLDMLSAKAMAMDFRWRDKPVKREKASVS
jgi:thioester reductase-like protein